MYQARTYAVLVFLPRASGLFNRVSARRLVGRRHLILYPAGTLQLLANPAGGYLVTVYEMEINQISMFENTSPCRISVPMFHLTSDNNKPANSYAITHTISFGAIGKYPFPARKEAEIIGNTRVKSEQKCRGD
jgi:hypothetical protein